MREWKPTSSKKKRIFLRKYFLWEIQQKDKEAVVVVVVVVGTTLLRFLHLFRHLYLNLDDIFIHQMSIGVLELDHIPATFGVFSAFFKQTNDNFHKQINVQYSNACILEH